MDDDRRWRIVGRAVAILALVGTLLLAGGFFILAPFAGAEVFGGSPGQALLYGVAGASSLAAAILLVVGLLGRGSGRAFPLAAAALVLVAVLILVLSVLS